MLLLRSVAFVLGAVVVVGTLRSAIRTFRPAAQRERSPGMRPGNRLTAWGGSPHICEALFVLLVARLFRLYLPHMRV